MKKSRSGASRWPALILGAAALALLLSACAMPPRQRSQSGARQRAREIDRAERQWAEQGVDAYTIEVLAVSSIWHAQTQTVIVHDGVPAESFAECIPAPFEGDSCEIVDFNPADFTVEGLFERARAEAGRDAAYLTLTFEPTYGYPDLIAYDHPDILDEDWSLSVRAFTPLE